MAEDDVERLVERAEGAEPFDRVLDDYKRLARIVRELLPTIPDWQCQWSPSCPGSVPPEQWCDACRARALRARLNAIARGEA